MSKSVLLINNLTPLPDAYDYDGNGYHNVIVGTQTWLVESLKTTHLADGTPIPFESGPGNWVTVGMTDLAYSNPDFNASFFPYYGGLYSWTVTQSTLITGYHVPTLAELQTLDTYVSNNAYDLMATYYWNSHNGTDLYGYKSIPSGYIDISGGTASSPGVNTSNFIWSSTSIDTTYANSISLQDTDSSVNFITLSEKNWGYSIRLIKD